MRYIKVTEHPGVYRETEIYYIHDGKITNKTSQFEILTPKPREVVTISPIPWGEPLPLSDLDGWVHNLLKGGK